MRSQAASTRRRPPTETARPKHQPSQTRPVSGARRLDDDEARPQPAKPDGDARQSVRLAKPIRGVLPALVQASTPRRTTTDPPVVRPTVSSQAVHTTASTPTAPRLQQRKPPHTRRPDRRHASTTTPAAPKCQNPGRTHTSERGPYTQISTQAVHRSERGPYPRSARRARAGSAPYTAVHKGQYSRRTDN
jgi:hypothetical protein